MPSILGVIEGTERWCIEEGDSRALLKSLPDATIDSVICDPPYEIGFMGRSWDESGIAFDVELWREVLRVCKPGAHLCAFGGTRTYHRMACAIQDAGWEIRDSIDWIYGQGFPKSLNIRKAIEKGRADAPSPGAALWSGWGTALKPAHEPIVLARKPFRGSVAANVLEHGTGAINVDGCRVPHASAADFDQHAEGVAAIKARGGVMDNSWKNASDLSGANDATPLGRWPANVLLSHAEGCEPIGVRKVQAHTAWTKNDRPPRFTGDEVSPVHHADRDGLETVEHWRCAEGCPVALVGEQSGDRPSAVSNGSIIGPGYGGGFGATAQSPGYADGGGVSRYFATFAYEPCFYEPKAGRAEREKGCEYLPERPVNEACPPGAPGSQSPRAGAGRTGQRRNHHATVKPIAVTRWCTRLITPPGGVALDIFAGSGTGGIAALADGFRWIGFELDPKHVAIARARVLGDAPLLNRPHIAPSGPPEARPDPQLPLFEAEEHKP